MTVPQSSNWVSMPPALSQYTQGHVQVIFPGTSTDISYNASGGQSVRIGPLNTSCVRLYLLGPSSKVRFAFGDATVSALATSTPLAGPGGEYFGFTPGSYIAVISDDATTGTMNVTITG